MDKNNKDIYYSKYASEMRSLIKEQNKTEKLSYKSFNYYGNFITYVCFCV